MARTPRARTYGNAPWLAYGTEMPFQEAINDLRRVRRVAIGSRGLPRGSGALNAFAYFCRRCPRHLNLPAWMDGGGAAGQGVAYFKFDMYGIVPVST